MQPPVLRSRDQRGAGKPSPLQKEQGADGKGPERTKKPRTFPLTRNKGRHRDRADQREDKGVGLKTTEISHRHDRSSVCRRRRLPPIPRHAGAL